MLGWLKNIFGGSSKPGSRDFAREVLAQSWEAYRLARRDRPREHYQPLAYSGTSAALGSFDLMNRRVRDLVRNTAQAKRINQALTNLVVGTGIQTFSWPFAPAELFEIVTELETLATNDLGPRLSFALESDDLFEEWASDPKEFDVEGRLSWLEMQRMLLGECIQTGNGLLIRSYRKNYKIVPLAYQIVEREQLDHSKDRPASPDTNRIAGGIELDASGRPVAYHLFSSHPDDFAVSLTSSVPIPADRVIDLALFHRPSAVLGVSWLDAIGQSIFDRDSYVDSEIRSAALAAAFALVHKLTDPDAVGNIGFDDDLEDVDGYGNSEIKLGHSPIATAIKPEESVEIVNSNRPNPNASRFLELLDRDIASGVGVGYYSLTGHYANTSFSSTRAAKLDEDTHVVPLQRWFGTHAALPVRREFNRMAAASGLFSSLSASQFSKNERTFQRFDAIGCGRDLLDPQAEINARISSLRAGLSTFKEQCARDGKHWIRVLMQRAIEQSVAGLFGVEFDFSNGGSTPAPSGDSVQQPIPSEDSANA